MKKKSEKLVKKFQKDRSVEYPENIRKKLLKECLKGFRKEGVPERIPKSILKEFTEWTFLGIPVRKRGKVPEGSSRGIFWGPLEGILVGIAEKLSEEHPVHFRGYFIWRIYQTTFRRNSCRNSEKNLIELKGDLPMKFMKNVLKIL